MQTLESIVAEHPFFEGLKPPYLQLITGCASNVRFDTGKYIFREGEDASQFYLIRQGKVALEIFAAQHGLITIETIEAGEVLGWSWLFPPYVWHFSAWALEDTTAIFFYGTVLRDYCEKDHSLGLELFKRMSAVMLRRLQAARQKLLSVRKTA